MQSNRGEYERLKAGGGGRLSTAEAILYIGRRSALDAPLHP